MFRHERISVVNTTVALLLLSLIGGVVHAAAIEEVLVTARKVVENQQDVPVSITSLNAEDLEAFNVQEVRSLFDYIPGAWSGAQNGEQMTLTLRGILSSERGASDNPGVTLMRDGEVISRHFMASAPKFDLQRVEVLRGPQGTTYGRNSTAGTVNFISNRPTEEFSANIKVDVGNYNSRTYEGFVSGSMGENVRGRLSGYYSERDGYVEHTLTGEPLDNTDETAIRGQIEFDLSDRTSVLVTVNYTDSHADHFAIRKPDTSDPWGYSDFWGWPFLRFQDDDDPWHAAPSSSLVDGTPMGYDLETWGVSLAVEHSWDTVNLYSLTAYSHGEDQSVIDLMTGPIDFANENNFNDADTFSQEIRLDNSGNGSALEWVVGVYFATEDHDRDATTEAFFGHCEDAPAMCMNPPPIFGGGIPLPTLDASGTKDIVLQRNDTTSYAAFGELSYDISDKTNVIAGLRYSNDDRDYAGLHSAEGGLFFIFAGAPVDLDNSDTWSDLSYRLALTHRFNDQVMVYGSYTTAFKGGGFNPEPASADEVTAYDEENVASLELGTKMDLLDNRLRLNVTLFDTNYDDIQSQFLDERLGASTIGNIGKAYIRGIEVEAIGQIGEDFRLHGAYTYYDSEYEAWNPSTSVSDPDNIVGESLRGSYKSSFHISGVYTVNLAQAGSLDFRADYRQRGRANAVWVNDLVGSSTPGVEFINASIQYTSSDEKWSATLWGKNLGEEAEIKYKLFIAGVFTNRLRSYAAPRTYGLTLRYGF